MKKSFFAILAMALFVLLGCQSQKDDLNIVYEKYTLPNGLDVILHVDRSDPIVALAIQFHVGSNREVEGRTGFAHLFEHMMFQIRECRRGPVLQNHPGCRRYTERWNRE
jgi:zinc protease